MSKPISNNEFDNLDAFFGDKLKDASIPPPEKVWQQIEDSLNKDRKRKRRFLWIFFSGIFLIGTTVSIYFIVFDTKKSNTSLIAKVKSTPTVSKSTIANPTPLNSHIESKEQTKQAISENNPKEENSRTVKIQLGAFKKQKHQTYFSKLNLDVKSENLPNGITRYYTEIPESKVQQTLEQIKQNGFQDAFIKNETLLTSKTNIITHTHQQTEVNTTASKTNKEPVSFSTNSRQEANFIAAKQKKSKNNNIVANRDKQNGEPLNKTSVVYTKETDVANNLGTPNNRVQKLIIDSTLTKNNVPITTATNSTIIASSIVNNDVVLKDSLQKDTAINKTTFVKKDSSIIKPDSIKTSKPIATIDSSTKAPILNRWALLLTGGSNFIMKNTHSNLFVTSLEKQPSTYNATLKVEFKPFKKLAFTIGFSYNYFITQQDATLFYFNRYLTGDYTFYSSFGPLAVDKNTMLQGFSPLAPASITTFHANYSYTSKINALLIPLQTKYYYLNTKRINLFADIGFSGMVVLSQQTNLSVIKEGVTNNLSYNQITTTKFNGLLMLGLGGDIRLYKQLYFTIDGGFRYGLSNMSSTTGIKTIPAYFSANGGVKIKL